MNLAGKLAAASSQRSRAGKLAAASSQWSRAGNSEVAWKSMVSGLVSVAGNGTLSSASEAREKTTLHWCVHEDQVAGKLSGWRRSGTELEV